MKSKSGEWVSTKPWQTKEWKDMRKCLIKDHCEMCGGTEILVLHHIKTASVGLHAKGAFEDYMDPQMAAVQTLCRRCHFAAEHGMVLCSECRQHYHKPKYNKCYKCAQVDWVICKFCGERRHDSKYDSCTHCRDAVEFSTFTFCWRFGKPIATFEVECLECEFRTGEDDMGQSDCPKGCIYLIPPAQRKEESK